jgi:hypothetical protein
MLRAIPDDDTLAFYTAVGFQVLVEAGTRAFARAL